MVSKATLEARMVGVRVPVRGAGSEASAADHEHREVVAVTIP